MAIKYCSMFIVFTFFLAFLNMGLLSNAAREIDMVQSLADNNATLDGGELKTTTTGRIVVYWGRDSRESTLATTCSTGNYAFVIISYLSSYGNGRTPVLSLSGHCEPSTGGCQSLSNDIQICQNQGVRVLVSIGGPPGGYSLAGTDSDSFAVADYLWNAYLGGQSAFRPFGSAVLDGVDFDIRGGYLWYPALIQRLTSHNTPTRKVYITGSSPCLTWPTAIRRFGGAYDTGLVDYAWIHFYDLYANTQSCEYDPANVTAFREAWNLWATLPIQQIFFGTLASIDAGGSGYIPPNVFTSQILPFIRGTPKYGGVVVWNKYFDEQTGYTAAIRASV